MEKCMNDNTQKNLYSVIVSFNMEEKDAIPSIEDCLKNRNYKNTKNLKERKDNSKTETQMNG
jgi:hypothetical protein